jgi:hypothetical protein
MLKTRTCIIKNPSSTKANIKDSTMSSCSNSIQALALFRAALAVNNCGVSLLEKGHVREAQKTFREALILMKQAAATNKPTTSTSTTLSCDTNIKETLQNASARLVRAQNSPVHTVFEISAIEDGDDLNNIKSSLQYGPSSSLFFPIRIRSTSQDDDNLRQQQQQQQLQMKRPMAIVLYNQAVAHLLWGQSAIMSETSIQQTHYSAAVSCLTVAQAVLSQHLAKDQQHNDDFQRQCTLIVQACVVNSLVLVMQVKNRLAGLAGLDDEDNNNNDNLQSSRQSLEEWIHVQSKVLEECDSMDKQQVVISPRSAAAA